MKVLIINPPGREENPSSHFPIGLGYIAKALLNDDHVVNVLELDAIREKPVKFLSKERMKELISLKIKDCDIVFIGGLTNSYIWIKWINKTIKSINQSMMIVVGNTVGSTIPMVALEYLYCDVVVLFEGEITSVELLRALENKQDLSKVKGIWYKNKEGKIHENKARPFIQNLDEIDFPAWDLFPMEVYLRNSSTGSGSLRSINVVAGRGCPFNCNYCCKVFGRTTRLRSPDNIIEEIKILYNKYSVRYIGFSDDLFTINKKFIFEFCNKLIDSKLNIKWSVTSRVNTIDEDTVRIMKKAGCNHVGYGAESGSQKILDNMNKMQTLDDIKKAIIIFRKSGMNDVAGLMAGYPGETKETLKETVKFAIKHKLPAEFFYTTAYPGTKLYEDWKDKIIEKYGSEDKYFEALADPNTRPLMNFTNMTDEEYIKMKKWGDEKLRKNLRLILYRIHKYFRATGLHGFNKRAFVLAKEMLFGR